LAARLLLEKVVSFQEGCGPYLLGGKPPTPSSISNTGLIDGVPLPILMALQHLWPLELLHHNGSNPSEPTSGSNPVGSRAYFQHVDRSIHVFAKLLLIKQV
jgi:hypothetical protein